MPLPSMESQGWSVAKLLERPKRILRCRLDVEAQMSIAASGIPEAVRYLAMTEGLDLDVQDVLVEAAQNATGLADLLALNEGVDPLTLDRLASSPLLEVGSYVARNQSASEDTLIDLARSGNFGTLAALASRTSVPVSVQEVLADGRDENVLFRLLTNPDVDSNVAAKAFAALQVPLERRNVAAEPGIAESVQWLLFDWAWHQVKTAWNPQEDPAGFYVSVASEFGDEVTTLELLAEKASVPELLVRLSLTKFPLAESGLLQNAHLVFDPRMPAGFVIEAFKSKALPGSLAEELAKVEGDMESFLALSERWPESFADLVEACKLVAR